MQIELDSIDRLTKDIKTASHSLSRHEARFLTDAYYSMQSDRIRANNQVRALNESAEPNLVLQYLAQQRQTLEAQVKRALDAYSASHPAGIWARSITGIGPVIAAGLLAHIDVHRAQTAGQVWRFAGLDPTSVWGKGERRPWNAKLKKLCWIVGESFVKVSSRESDIYGKIWRVRKDLEIARNEAGQFADQAKAALEAKNFGADTNARKAYEQGKLPDARIHLRAERYAVKLFLSHFHHVLFENEFGTPPPKPYIFSRPEHTHFMAPPNWPLLSEKCKSTEHTE